jgi:hypothetical protein
MFEYKFVRTGEGRVSALFGPQEKARNAYEAVVHDHAQDGWRLVQIFAPGVAAFGAAKYYELIFERQLPVDDRDVETTRDSDAELAFSGLTG